MIEYLCFTNLLLYQTIHLKYWKINFNGIDLPYEFMLKQLVNCKYKTRMFIKLYLDNISSYRVPIYILCQKIKVIS